MTKITINHVAYEYKKTLSKTPLIEVMQAARLDNQHTVAIKIFHLDRLIENYKNNNVDKKKMAAYVSAQIEMEEKVLGLFQRFISSQLISGYIEYGCHYIVMPFFPGEYVNKEYLQSSFVVKKKIATSLVEEIKKLHENEFAHLNISLQSFLINDKNQAQLVGFSHCEYGHSLANEYFFRLKGLHIPPEIISHYDLKNNTHSLYGKETDMFALGMTWYELFYKKSFDKKQDEEERSRIMRYHQFYIDTLSFLSNEKTIFASIILDLIALEPNKRLTIHEIEHKLKTLQESCLTERLPVASIPKPKEHVIATPRAARVSCSCYSLFAVIVPTAILAIGSEYVRRRMFS